MAGDWIKVEHATLEKPEVGMFAELLGIPVDQALGILLRFWVWLDRNSCNGLVTHVSRLSIDGVTHTPGFSNALAHVGWLQFDDEAQTLTVPNFGNHNGNTAKSRAQTKKRVQRFRNDSVTVPALPREEKRRDIKTTTNPSSPPAPPGVRDEVWAAWINYRGRKKLTAHAVSLQTSELQKLRAGGSDPNAVIEQSIRNGWSGLFPVHGNGAPQQASAKVAM
jgi:hypothetical protein